MMSCIFMWYILWYELVWVRTYKRYLLVSPEGNIIWNCLPFRGKYIYIAMTINNTNYLFHCAMANWLLTIVQSPTSDSSKWIDICVLRLLSETKAVKWISLLSTLLKLNSNKKKYSLDESNLSYTFWKLCKLKCNKMANKKLSDASLSHSMSSRAKKKVVLLGSLNIYNI